MNKFTAIGRVITDPEFRQVGGVDVCDFKLSVRTRGKNDQGYPNSIIVKCTVWRKLAEMAKNFGLYKGRPSAYPACSTWMCTPTRTASPAPRSSWTWMTSTSSARVICPPRPVMLMTARSSMHLLPA